MPPPNAGTISFGLVSVWSTIRTVSGLSSPEFGLAFSDDNEVTWKGIAFTGAGNGVFTEEYTRVDQTDRTSVTHIAVIAFTDIPPQPTTGEIKEMKAEAIISLPPGFTLVEVGN